MALNPEIALNVQTPDIGGGIMRLAQVKRQKEADQMAMQNQQIQTQAAQQQLQAGQMELDRAHLEESILQAVQVAPLLEAGDYAGVESILTQERQKMASRGGNTTDIDEAIQTLKTNPRELTNVTKSMIGLGQQLGIVAAPAKEEGFTLSEGQARFDAQGNPIAVVSKSPMTTIGKARYDLNQGNINDEQFRMIVQKESGLKSPQEISQMVEIEKLKAIAGRDDEKRRMELQKLQNEIDQGAVKVEESQEKIEKGGQLKAKTLRLVNELMADTDALRSVVGPYDQSWLSPTLFDKSLRAQTKINQLKSILTAENLGLMTGVLSETDLKVIASIAGGGIDIEGSDDAMVEELTRMQSALQGQGVQPEAGFAQQTQLPAGVRSIKRVN
jgi:hypothetical protein